MKLSNQFKFSYLLVPLVFSILSCSPVAENLKIQSTGKYYYKLTQYDFDGSSEDHGMVVTKDQRGYSYEGPIQVIPESVSAANARESLIIDPKGNGVYEEDFDNWKESGTVYYVTKQSLLNRCWLAGSNDWDIYQGVESIGDVLGFENMTSDGTEESYFFSRPFNLSDQDELQFDSYIVGGDISTEVNLKVYLTDEYGTLLSNIDSPLYDGLVNNNEHTTITISPFIEGTSFTMARFKFVYTFNSQLTPVSVYFDNLIVEGTHQLNENTCDFGTLPITLKYKKATGFTNGNLVEFEVETAENSNYVEIHRQFVEDGEEYNDSNWELAHILDCKTVGYYAYFDSFHQQK